MMEQSPNPILNERVKPAMVNPRVRHTSASTDILWVLLCVGIPAAILLVALGVKL